MSIEDLGHSLTLAKGLTNFKIKASFSQKLWSFETIFYMKAYGRMGMKFIQISYVT